jgi:UDP-N-acetylglucosamine:LPS N-acetylglucosamine transferase
MDQSIKPRLCLIASAGGHFAELLCLNELWRRHPCVWITSSFAALPAASGSAPRRRLIIDPQRNAFKFLVNLVQSLKIYLAERPDAVVTTGSGIAVPFCLWAKMFGCKVIFVETAAAVKDLSLTGKIMYPVADLFIVQWKSLAGRYRRAVYGGAFL